MIIIDSKTGQYIQVREAITDIQCMVFGVYDGWPGTYWLKIALNYLNTTTNPPNITTHNFNAEFDTCTAVNMLLKNKDKDEDEDKYRVSDRILEYSKTQGAIWRALLYISRNFVK